MSDKQARDEAIKQASEQVRNATTPFLRHAGDPVSAPDPVQEWWDYCAIVDDRTAIARKREYRERGDALAAALEAERELAREHAGWYRASQVALEAERERVREADADAEAWLRRARQHAERVRELEADLAQSEANMAREAGRVGKLLEGARQRDERIAALEAGLRELREGADRAVLDLKHDAVVGAPWVARVSNDLLERP